MEMSSRSLQVSTESLNGGGGGGGGGGGSSSSSSSKVARQPPRCQVEGCSVDLSGAKAYYGRHKVCGMHSKAPLVIVGGLEQIFCQQCSRFHQLPEFDQRKRSCRRRLADHNERRRKPPPAALSCSIGLPSSPFNVDNSSRLRGFLMNFACPQLSGSNEWTTTTTRAGDRMTSKQWQGGTELSVSESRGSDPLCALSLLSTFTEDRAPATTTITTSSFSVSSNNSFGVSPAMSSNISSNFISSSWGFRGREAVEPMQLLSELELALQRKRQCMELDDMVNQSM